MKGIEIKPPELVKLPESIQIQINFQLGVWFIQRCNSGWFQDDLGHQFRTEIH